MADAAVVVVIACGTVLGGLGRGVVVLEGGLPRGLGVVDEGPIVEAVVFGKGVVGPARRRGLMSDVTLRASIESSDPFLDAGSEFLRCEDELITTAMVEGLRTRVGVAGRLGLEIGLVGPDDGVQVR